MSLPWFTKTGTAPYDLPYLNGGSLKLANGNLGNKNLAAATVTAGAAAAAAAAATAEICGLVAAGKFGRFRVFF